MKRFCCFLYELTEIQHYLSLHHFHDKATEFEKIEFTEQIFQSEMLQKFGFSTTTMKFGLPTFQSTFFACYTHMA